MLVADRLARRSLPHPITCPLCDQEDENIQHILSTCVFAREFWFKIFSPLGFQRCTPSPNEVSFADWWRMSAKKVQKSKQRGFNTLIIMGAWLLRKHTATCACLRGPTHAWMTFYEPLGMSITFGAWLAL